MSIEERAYAEGLRDCGPFPGYVHLSESNRAAPDHGTVDRDEIYRALAEIECDGLTTLESMNHVDPVIASALAIWHLVEAHPTDVIDVGLPHLHAAAEAAEFRYD